MPRFEIEMTRTVKYELRVVVNADSEQEARERANRLDYDEELIESDGTSIDWEIVSIDEDEDN